MTTTSSGISLASTFRDSTQDRPGAFYVLFQNRVRKNVEDMKAAFLRIYGNTTIAYSFKTNYLKQVIEVVKDEDCMAEVVSPYEFKYARDLGFRHDRIVYNGVIRDPFWKFETAELGGIVNVDNIDEYEEISMFARQAKKKIELGVRVNIECSNGLHSRFGVDVEGDEFDRLMMKITEDPFVCFGGFHCHIGTARPARYWREKAKKLIELAKKYSAHYIDLGGGMYGPMIPELSSQFDEYVDSFDQYAEAVCCAMKDCFRNEEVELIVEPGTAIVGNAMDLVCQITNIKSVRGKSFVTVNTCSNHLGMICECRTIPTRILARVSDPNKRVHVEDALICGCTCLEFDYIRKGFTGDVGEGDYILFENVGAYSISATRNFIVPAPGVVDSDTFSCLCRRITGNEMFVKFLTNEL